MNNSTSIIRGFGILSIMRMYIVRPVVVLSIDDYCGVLGRISGGTVEMCCAFEVKVDGSLDKELFLARIEQYTIMFPGLEFVGYFTRKLNAQVHAEFASMAETCVAMCLDETLKLYVFDSEFHQVPSERVRIISTEAERIAMTTARLTSNQNRGLSLLNSQGSALRELAKNVAETLQSIETLDQEGLRKVAMAYEQLPMIVPADFRNSLATATLTALTKSVETLCRIIEYSSASRQIEAQRMAAQRSTKSFSGFNDFWRTSKQ